MSKSQYITLSSTIPIYNSLLEHLEKLLDEDDDMFCRSPEVYLAISHGYAKLKSYYSKTDDSKVYSIATSRYFSFDLFIDLFILISNYIYIFFFFNFINI